MSHDNGFIWVTDDKNIEPMAVSIHSLLRHWRGAQSPTIYVIAVQVDKKIRDRFKQWFTERHPRNQLNWVEQDSAGLPPGKGHISSATYARLLIPEIIPENRIFYIDTDVLIRQDASSVLSINYDDMLLAATPDAHISCITETVDDAKSYGTGDVTAHGYFNSGVMALNVDRWRLEKFSESCMRWARDFSSNTQCCDQDVLNVVVAGRWTRLDPRWNCQVGGLTYNTPFSVADLFARALWIGRYRHLRAAGAIHFTGSLKPWGGGLRTLGIFVYHRELLRSHFISPYSVLSRLTGALRKTIAKSRAAVLAERSPERALY